MEVKFPQRDTVVSGLFSLFAQNNLQLICLSKTVSESAALTCKSFNGFIILNNGERLISDCQYVFVSYPQIYADYAIISSFYC